MERYEAWPVLDSINIGEMVNKVFWTVISNYVFQVVIGLYCLKIIKFMNVYQANLKVLPNRLSRQ